MTQVDVAGSRPAYMDSQFKPCMAARYADVILKARCCLMMFGSAWSEAFLMEDKEGALSRQGEYTKRGPKDFKGG